MSNVILSPDTYLLYLIPALLLVAFILIAASVRILREYERAVVFTLGRFQKVKGPGLALLLPFFQEMVRVDLRIQLIEIPTQDVIIDMRAAGRAKRAFGTGCSCKNWSGITAPLSGRYR